MTDDDRREVGLVSCVKTKRDEPTVPKDLYTSAYFQKMRRYAERAHDDWWILSAKHRLLDPDGPPIDPYEETLRNASPSERREWTTEVVAEMGEEELLGEPVVFVIHAGKDYYEHLVPKLEAHNGVKVEIPTEGLQIGKKLSWYGERIEG